MGFFKAYDMRGTFGSDFDLDLVHRVGLALPQVVKGSHWLVGRDCRVTSLSVRDALVKGLCEAGADVTDLGLCTTPMVYFFTAEDGYDGSVMITASHNPPSDNGLKVSMRTALPVGFSNGLGEVERLCSQPMPEPTGRMGSVRDAGEATLGRYVEWQRKHSDASRLANLNFAVDCSNGMSSLLVHELFPDAIVINDRLDGSFPCHSPNPLKAEAREQLAALVRERGLDCGVIFDGDADRAMFVDERGEFVQPDALIPLVAIATRKSGMESRVVLHDVRTSRGAIETLSENGFEPVMVPVGHAFAKPVMRSRNALCGGELAGHYYFGDFFGCDSGLLAAGRILGEISAAKARGETFSQLMKPILSRYANSGELNFRVEDKDSAIARVLDAAKGLGAETGRSEIDGVRLEFDNGWISVRKSNTEPYLRLLVECRDAGKLQIWKDALAGAIVR